MFTCRTYRGVCYAPQRAPVNLMSGRATVQPDEYPRLDDCDVSIVGGFALHFRSVQCENSIDFTFLQNVLHSCLVFMFIFCL